MTLKQEVLQKLIDAWPDGITNHDFPAGTSLTQRIADLKSKDGKNIETCLLYTSPSPRDATLSRMPSSA